jgi:hypothetical protein
VKKIEKCKKEMSRPTSSRPSSAKPNTVAVLPNLKGFVFTEKLGSGTYATVNSNSIGFCRTWPGASWPGHFFFAFFYLLH